MSEKQDMHSKLLFIKQKMFVYAKGDDITVAARAVFYEVMELIEFLGIKEPESVIQRIPKSDSIVSETPKKTEESSLVKIPASKKKQEDTPKAKTDSLEKVKGDNQKVVQEVKKLKDTNSKLKEQKPAEKVVSSENVVSSKKDDFPEPDNAKFNKKNKGLFGQDTDAKKGKDKDDDLELRDFDKDLDNLIEEISSKLHIFLLIFLHNFETSIFI